MRRKVKGRKRDTKKPSGDTWYVYLLRCAGGSLYTGITKDVSRRCEQHNAGTASRYTCCRRPTCLVYEEVLDEELAGSVFETHGKSRRIRWAIRESVAHSG